MNTLIFVPNNKARSGRGLLNEWVEIFEQAGLQVIRRQLDHVQLSSGDSFTIFYVEDIIRQADVCGQAATQIMVHLDLVCRIDWRQLEEMILATCIGTKGNWTTHRAGEYKVYTTTGG